MSGAAAWADAMQALALFAADPAGLGGLCLRAGAGPVRDRFLALLQQALPVGMPVRRVPLHVADDRLLGGLDLAATLQAGRPVAQNGLLTEADGGIVVLAMAERIEPGTAARLRAAMDEGAVTLQREGLSRVLPAQFGVVALDEGADPDERPPASLLDRMAFHLDLSAVSLAEMCMTPISGAPMSGASMSGAKRSSPGLLGNVPASAPRDMHGISQSLSDACSPNPERTPQHQTRALGTTQLARQVAIAADEDAGISHRAVGYDQGVEILCQAAASLGIDSLRAPMLALRTARVAAALAGEHDFTEADLGLAARLVLAPRATCFPAPEQTGEEPEPEPEDTPPDQQAILDQPPEDVVLDAIKAALPPDLLARLAAGDASRSKARAPGRAGQVKASFRRGRPIGSRAGEPKNGARLHLLETLKAAAPWQTLRRRTDRFEVRRDDFRIVRYRQRVGTTTVFAVDASGSAAMHRLAEAKGAVELLLADCYIRRDQVALIAFRGTGATLLLPPTGSLLRAKRRLAGLPGGGPTPLAAGIEAAMALADAVRRAGRTPVITLLTDARANIARDGSGGRPRAEAEAMETARSVRAAGVAALLVDTSPRPNPFARRLAEEMRAHYVPLPYADASALSRAARSAATA